MKPVHMSRHTSVIVESETPIPAQIDGEVLLERRYEIDMLAGRRRVHRAEDDLVNAAAPRPHLRHVCD